MMKLEQKLDRIRRITENVNTENLTTTKFNLLLGNQKNLSVDCRKDDNVQAFPLRLTILLKFLPLIICFVFWVLVHSIEGVEMVILSSSGPVWIRHILACMGGCFGCYSRPAPIIAVDEPSKGLRIQGQPVHKRTLSDDFWWSSSTMDLDNSMLQSLRSNSSISTSGLNLGSGLGSIITEPEFVNHGLNLWNESRLQWIGSGKPNIQSKQKRGRALSWNATYDSVIARKTPFSRPVPLSEMVDFLVEAWDQDGMYDY